MPKSSLLTIILAPLFLSACAGPPFSYAEDRCVGSANQCRSSCIGINDGPAQAACYARCQDRESTCYSTGYDGVGSSLSEESLIGLKKSEAEKQADYERWKAKKAREEAEDQATAPQSGQMAPQEE